jgi:hypothetical protein
MVESIDDLLRKAKDMGMDTSQWEKDINSPKLVQVEEAKPVEIAAPIYAGKMYYFLKDHGCLITFCGYTKQSLEAEIKKGIEKVRAKKGINLTKSLTYGIDDVFIGFQYCSATNLPKPTQQEWYKGDAKEIKGKLLTPEVKQAFDYIIGDNGDVRNPRRGMHLQANPNLPFTVVTQKQGEMYNSLQVILRLYKTIEQKDL